MNGQAGPTLSANRNRTCKSIGGGTETACAYIDLPATFLRFLYIPEQDWFSNLDAELAELKGRGDRLLVE